MRILLILLLLAGFLHANKKDTCYSVQLSSFKTSNLNYNFESKNFPSSCKLLEFTNMNAVRCGCFKKYNDAKRQKQAFNPVYPGSSIVTTYSYRFAPQKSIAKTQSFKAKKKDIINISEEEKQEESEALELAPEVNDTYSFVDDMVIQGNVNLEFQKYITNPNDKHNNNYTASAELEVTYTKDDFKAFAQFRAQQDYYDLKGTSEHNDRSYLRVNELYGQYDFEDSQVLFGKNVRFWGALEVHNLTDGFNIIDLRSDPTENDKVGSWNAAYTYFTDDGEISIIAKFNEEDRKMPTTNYSYYPFSNERITYGDKVKTEKSANRPSIYIKYSASTDTEYMLDYSIIFENGYDSQRYYDAPRPGQDIHENAYIVNKLMSYNTLVVDSTLFKLEAVYTDVVDNDVVSDYYNIGLGVEHTLTQVNGEADLGLLAEYYKYETINSDGKFNYNPFTGASTGNYSSDQLFEVFQNDIFIGARYSFNQGNDATIVGGGIFDLDQNEQIYYIEY